MMEDKKMSVVSEVTRGKGIKFCRIRRITGYITGDINTWNSAKKSEMRDRVKHV
jgi:ribonucleoside-triphosphate reductase